MCECWTDQNTYAKYYESGVDSMFDFAFADKSGIIANVMNGKASATSYAKNLETEQGMYAQYNPDYINAPFYTNHDMGAVQATMPGRIAKLRRKWAMPLIS